MKLPRALIAAGSRWTRNTHDAQAAHQQLSNADGPRVIPLMQKARFIAAAPRAAGRAAEAMTRHDDGARLAVMMTLGHAIDVAAAAYSARRAARKKQAPERTPR